MIRLIIKVVNFDGTKPYKSLSSNKNGIRSDGEVIKIEFYVNETLYI